MYTELGKWLKIFRLSEGIRLYDMAKKIGVSSAFLSAIETGNKTTPVSFFDRLTSVYNLSSEQKSELMQKIVETREQQATGKPSIRFTIDHPKQGVDDLAFSFARKANYLTEQERKQLLKILNKAAEGDSSVSN
ncbi:MAG: helix-turn-helix domain-containing protein [Alphaproteobacteria bacterium]|nr:helix-turn-helix domain-containing protein [Alphaproteobacteria bacterium]